MRGRPARRQPGADRPDEPGPQAGDVPAARAAWATRRSRSASRSASQTDFDFVRQLDRGRPHPRRRRDPGADPVPRAPDRADLRVAARRQAGDRALLQLDLDAAAPGRVRPGPDGITDIADAGRAAVPEVRRDADPRHRHPLRVLARVLHRHRARVRRRGLRRGHRGHRPDARPADHHQPAGHRRDGHAQRLRRLDRVDAPPPAAPRLASCCRCTRTTTAAPASPPPSWATWPAPTASRAACSATASAPATSAWSRWGSTCSARASTRRSTSPTSTRSAARSSTATSCRCHERHPYGGDLVYTAFSGSHQDAIKKGLEAPGEGRRGRRAARSTSIAWAVPVPADRPEGRRPHLRGRDPGEQPVRQGRRRLPDEDRAPARPAAAAADRVQRRRPAAHRRRGRRGRRRPSCGTAFADEYLPVGVAAGAGSRCAAPGRRRPTSGDDLSVDLRRRRHRDRRSRAAATARSRRSSRRSPTSASTSGCSTTTSTR